MNAEPVAVKLAAQEPSAGGDGGGVSPPRQKPPPPRDAASIEEKGLPEAPFPAASSPEFRIHFDAAVHEQIVRHAAETLEVELCGILVGRVRKDRHGPYLAVTGAIRGEHAENDGAQVKLTHATWDHVHREKDARFPDDAIVGWYHTHPGFGIFLSQMDLFIHEFFFNAPSQIAHVIDPRTRDEGVFHWAEGKTVRASRFWVGAAERRASGGAFAAQGAGAGARGAGAGASAGAGAGIGSGTGTGGTGTGGTGTGGTGTGRGPGGDSQAMRALIPGTRAAEADRAAREDEIDLAGGLAGVSRYLLPLAVGILIGIVAARSFGSLELESARNDLLRAEVRALVGDAASAWSSADDLKAVERRMTPALAMLAEAAPGGVTPSAGLTPVATAAIARDMEYVHTAIVSLARSTGEREDAIARRIARRASGAVTLEDEVTAVRREGASARRLALAAYCESLRAQLDVSLARRTPLSPAERESFVRRLEDALSVEPSEQVRALMVQRFPELAAPPAPPPTATAQPSTGGR